MAIMEPRLSANQQSNKNLGVERLCGIMGRHGGVRTYLSLICRASV